MLEPLPSLSGKGFFASSAAFLYLGWEDKTSAP